jgi:hypothetical protein
MVISHLCPIISSCFDRINDFADTVIALITMIDDFHHLLKDSMFMIQ